ncbi:MAG: peptide deformylase [Bacteroidota bacterium]
MILPIIGYGHPALRKATQEVTPDHPELDQLIANMFETMYNAQGVGLAAPQVNLDLRIFIVDGRPMDGEEEEDLSDFRKVFINPRKVEESGKVWPFEEGCLSIPDIRETVRRPEQITLEYMDESFQPQKETFTGFKARVVQHEYDHLEGKLFTDYITPLRRRMVKKRLHRISLGDIHTDYPMKFFTGKK